MANPHLTREVTQGSQIFTNVQSRSGPGWEDAQSEACVCVCVYVCCGEGGGVEREGLETPESEQGRPLAARPLDYFLLF